LDAAGSGFGATLPITAVGLSASGPGFAPSPAFASPAAFASAAAEASSGVAFFGGTASTTWVVLSELAGPACSPPCPADEADAAGGLAGAAAAVGLSTF
jgi:hypothetical protein